MIAHRANIFVSIFPFGIFITPISLNVSKLGKLCLCNLKTTKTRKPAFADFLVFCLLRHSPTPIEWRFYLRRCALFQHLFFFMFRFLLRLLFHNFNVKHFCEIRLIGQHIPVLRFRLIVFRIRCLFCIFFPISAARIESS